MELLRQVVGLEYQALALVAGPLTSLAAGWGLRQVMAHLRDRRAAGCVTRLVAWAEQAIPDKSARYHEVAALLSRRFPMLSGEQMEVLIESEVLGLKTSLRAAAQQQQDGATSTAAVEALPMRQTTQPTQPTAAGEAEGTPGPAETVTAGVPAALEPAGLRV